MKFSELIQSIKSIQADPEYKVRSRTEILLSPRKEREALPRWVSILRPFELAATMALAAAIFMILAGIGPGKDLASPLRLSSLDPAAIRAEAQAVDIQVKLANLAYQESAAISSNAAGPTSSSALEVVIRSTRRETQPVVSATSTPNATNTISVDEALELLSK